MFVPKVQNHTFLFLLTFRKALVSLVSIIIGIQFYNYRKLFSTKKKQIIFSFVT